MYPFHWINVWSKRDYDYDWALDCKGMLGSFCVTNVHSKWVQPGWLIQPDQQQTIGVDGDHGVKLVVMFCWYYQPAGWVWGFHHESVHGCRIALLMVFNCVLDAFWNLWQSRLSKPHCLYPLPGSEAGEEGRQTIGVIQYHLDFVCWYAMQPVGWCVRVEYV